MALGPDAAPVENWYLDRAGRLHILQADAWTVIEESIDGPTSAHFRTSTRLPVGRRIAIDFQGQRLFEGVLLKTEGHNGLPIDNVAQDYTSFINSRLRP